MTRLTITIGLSCVLAYAATTRAEDQAKAAAAEAAAERKAIDAWFDRGMPETDFNGQDLADVLDYTRDLIGGKIFVNWKELEAAGVTKDAKVTLRLPKTTIRVYLTKVLESVSTDKVKLHFAIDDGHVVISTTPDPKMPGVRIARPKLPPEVDRLLLEINFNGNTFADVIDFLRDVSGTKIVVDWTALEKAGIGKSVVVTARLKNVRLSHLLQTVMQDVAGGKVPLQATFADKTITITTAPKAEKPIPAGDAKPQPAEKSRP